MKKYPIEYEKDITCIVDELYQKAQIVQETYKHEHNAFVTPDIITFATAELATYYDIKTNDIYAVEIPCFDPNKLNSILNIREKVINLQKSGFTHFGILNLVEDNQILLLFAVKLPETINWKTLSKEIFRNFDELPIINKKVVCGVHDIITKEYHAIDSKVGFIDNTLWIFIELGLDSPRGFDFMHALGIYKNNISLTIHGELGIKPDYMHIINENEKRGILCINYELDEDLINALGGLLALKGYEIHRFSRVMPK